MRKNVIANGALPKTLNIYTREKTNARFYWNDFGIVEDGVEVIPAFATDADCESMQETAKYWASDSQPITVPNEPFHEMKICGLEIRSEGGRAYKVLTENGHYFDLREDVLLDIINYSGVERGGRIVGDFVWGRINSQMRIVRVGSRLYDAMIECNERRELKNLKKSDLELGGVYENKRGSMIIFLGYVNTIDLSYIVSYQKHYPNHMRGGKTYYHANDPTYFMQRELFKHIMVVEIYDWYRDREKTNEQVWMKRINEILYGTEDTCDFWGDLNIKKDVSVCRKIGQIELPNNYLQIIRQNVTEPINKISTKKQEDNLSRDYFINIVLHASIANICDISEEPHISEEFKHLYELIPTPGVWINE